MFTGLEGLTIGPRCCTPGCPYRELQTGLCRKCLADQKATSSLLPSGAALMMDESAGGIGAVRSTRTWVSDEA